MVEAEKKTKSLNVHRISIADSLSQNSALLRKAMEIPSSQRSADIQDPYNKYKAFRVRHLTAKQKMRLFFGTQVPYDVSLRNIDEFGLPAMLQSNVPLCYFLMSLVKEIASENLVHIGNQLALIDVCSFSYLRSKALTTMSSKLKMI